MHCQRNAFIFMFLLIFSVLSLGAFAGENKDLEEWAAAATNSLRKKPLVLMGPSSCGKTTSLRLLSQRLPDLSHLEHVVFFNKVVNSFLRKYDSQTVSTLRTSFGNSFFHILFSAALGSSHVHQANLPQELQEILQTIQLDLRAQKDKFNRDKLVVMEQEASKNHDLRLPVSLGIRTSTVHLRAFENLNPHRIMLTCPIQTLVTRFLARNEAGVRENNFAHYRPPEEFVNRLSEVFIFSNTPLQGRQPLELVPEASLCNLVQAVYGSALHESNAFNPQDPLCQLDALSSGTIYVYNKHEYDHLIDVQEKSPETVVQEILHYLAYQEHLRVSLRTQYRDFELSHMCAQNTPLLLLTGVSSSGKSTLCRGMQQSNPSLIVIEFDKIFFGHCFSFLKEAYPAAYEMSRLKLGDALLYYMFSPLDPTHPFGRKFIPEPQFSSELTSLESNLTDLKTSFHKNFETIYSTSWREAIKTSYVYNSSGVPVVVDSAVRPSLLEFWKMHRPSVQTILVYTPLSSVIRLLQIRNKFALAHHLPLAWRDPLPLVTQFFTYYELKDRVGFWDEPLEYIDKQGLLNQLENVAPFMNNTQFNDLELLLKRIGKKRSWVTYSSRAYDHVLFLSPFERALEYVL